jgi:hypothetical protein
VNELAVIDPTEALERAADPGEFVVMALERGKSWLAEALAHGDLDALVNVKGYAETLRVATMQKQLGQDAVLSATELVRRAERCIGLGIRAGQEAGRIAVRGDNTHTMTAASDDPLAPRIIKQPVGDFATDSELHGNNRDSAGIYDITDGVSNEAFEAALAEGKSEGNLSRFHLADKVKPDRAPKVRKVKPDRAPKPSSRSQWQRGTPRINPERVIEQTVIALEGLALGLALLTPDDYSSLDADKRPQWIERLTEPLAAITRMKKGLCE